MTSKIILKKSSVVDKIPLTTDLEYGELALNYADGKLYYKTSANTIQNFISGGVVSVAGSTGIVTSSQILEGIKLVDGPGSGLDADLLDGQQGSYYQSALGFTPVNKAGDTITGNLTITGDLIVTGLVSGGSDLTTITKTLTLTTDWQNTGIKSTDLATGTYIIQLIANDTGSGGTNNNEYYSGTMSWYSADTNSALELPTDEIVLHRAGASGDGALYLRTYRTATADPDNLKLQIYSNTANASAANYVFKFKRMI